MEVFMNRAKDKLKKVWVIYPKLTKAELRKINKEIAEAFANSLYPKFEEYYYERKRQESEGQNSGESIVDTVEEHVPNDLSIIIEKIKEEPTVSLSRLAKLIGKTKKTVQRIIKRSGKIIRVGEKKTGHWEIKE